MHLSLNEPSKQPAPPGDDVSGLNAVCHNQRGVCSVLRPPSYGAWPDRQPPGHAVPASQHNEAINKLKCRKSACSSYSWDNNPDQGDFFKLQQPFKSTGKGLWVDFKQVPEGLKFDWQPISRPFSLPLTSWDGRCGPCSRVGLNEKLGDRLAAILWMADFALQTNLTI